MRPSDLRRYLTFANIVAVFALCLSTVAIGYASKRVTSWPETLGAYIVQLFAPLLIGFVIYLLSPRVRQILIGPQLELTIASAVGSETVAIGDGTRRPVRYYHIDVRNKREWAPAHGAEVRVERVCIRYQSRGPFEEALTHPLQLEWQYSRQRTSRHIQINYFERCDLAKLDPAHRPELVLCLYTRPNNLRDGLATGGIMRLELRASAENFIGKPQWFELSWENEQLLYPILRTCEPMPLPVPKKQNSR